MVARSVLWVVLPGVVYGVLASAFLDFEPPRWRVRLGRRIRSMNARLHEAVTPRVRHEEADPFDALTLQIRLGQLAAQVQALEADQHAWARGRRIKATQDAYDDLLMEACHLAGIEALARDPDAGIAERDPERFREEMELASRGWSW